MSKKYDFEIMKNGSKYVGTIYKPELYDNKILLTYTDGIVCEYDYRFYELIQPNLIKNEKTFDMFIKWDNKECSIWI